MATVTILISRVNREPKMYIINMKEFILADPREYQDGTSTLFIFCGSAKIGIPGLSDSVALFISQVLVKASANRRFYSIAVKKNGEYSKYWCDDGPDYPMSSAIEKCTE